MLGSHKGVEMSAIFHAFIDMEQKLQETYPKEEDRLFYYHSSEKRIVLSHALFWTMTQL